MECADVIEVIQCVLLLYNIYIYVYVYKCLLSLGIYVPPYCGSCLERPERADITVQRDMWIHRVW